MPRRKHDTDPSTSAESGDNARIPSTDELWVYANLDHPGVGADESPSAGAASLLAWARSARDRFYGQKLPRVLTAIVASMVAASDAPVVEGLDGLPEEALLAMGDRFMADFDRSEIAAAPVEIVSSVEAMVSDWTMECGIELTPGSRESLVCQLEGIVSQNAMASAASRDAVEDLR